ncbi:putative membrane protein [Catalinimonas alkaloidigena]|uniref:DUF502 domain-containing protein n=1 Tax=Catalinimonas alkaloidigena TaxID=1075417 RepID=UPI0024067E1B|nr:DUF502 domain-containing protein [Catalinimonas alkaloidigena]MDF9796105.1 putative membrane protein [Catalinimonas alkaloidigena]
MQHTDQCESENNKYRQAKAHHSGKTNKSIAMKNHAHHQKVTWNRAYIFRTMIDGALLVLPLAIILFALYLLFRFVFNLLVPISAILTTGSEEPHWSVNIISLVILLLFLFAVGLATRNRSGKFYYTYFERNYLSQIPLYTTVKDTVQQFSGLKKMPFSQVVLIDPFKTGVLMTGFVTEEVSKDIFTVFVPTAPNPTNGNIYHVPKECVQFLKVGTDKAMRTVVSMGTGSTCLFSENNSAHLNAENPRP